MMGFWEKVTLEALFKMFGIAANGHHMNLYSPTPHLDDRLTRRGSLLRRRGGRSCTQEIGNITRFLKGEKVQ